MKMYDHNRTHNEFMRILYNKKKFDLIGWIKYKRYLRHLKYVSPGFDMLCEIADFCKLLELVYMYDNSKRNKLSSNTKQPYGKNSFIYSDSTVLIKFDLIEESKFINITINRLVGTSSESNFAFSDGEAYDIIDNENNRHIFLTIINLVMNALSELIDTYYRKL